MLSRACAVLPTQRPLTRQHICAPARAHSAGPSSEAPVRYDVHGRHVQVDETLREAVITRLSPVIQRIQSTSQFMEGAGGVSSVDVRLMNTQAEIRLHPVHMDKAHHDTFLRQGELVASSSDGADAWDCFERAADQLERKLKPQKKAPPKKVNYRSFGSSSRSNSTGGGRL